MLDIKNIEGKVVFSTPINKGCKRKYTLMQEDYISLVFSVEEPIYFRLGDSIYDSLFEIIDLVSPKYNDATAGYDYEVRFDKYYWKWKNKKFFYTEIAREASWSLTANLDTQLSIVIKNLEFLNYRYKGKAFTFSVDSTVENVSKPLRYDNLNIIEALNLMAQTWECEWWVTDNIIHFGRCEYGTAVDFKLNDNVEKMSKSEGKQTFATRVYAFGSERNITKNYRPTDSMAVNGVVQKRLMLPVGTPFIDAYEGMTNEEAVEQVVIFDEVYPKLISKVSKVESKEGKDEVGKIWTYFISDDSLKFDKKYILPDTELRLVFQSGKLNGLDFALSFADNKFEIIRNEDYGRLLPDDILKPEIGDEFILHGYDTTFVSDALLPKAEQELKEKAIQFVEKSKVDPATYECSMMSDFMFNGGNVRTFEVGDRVRLINKAYFKDSRVSRIIGYEYPLDMPYDSPTYIVGETASYSHLEEIKADVKELTYKEKTFSGSGSNVYVIGQYDSTPPTDRNVLSSQKSLNSFHRKDKTDSTDHLQKFNKGAEFGDYKNKKGAYINEEGKADFNEVQTNKVTTKDLVSTNTKTTDLEADVSTLKKATINGLVAQLAKMHSLTVEDTANILKAVVGSISSEKFVSGFAGEGFRIAQAINGDWNLEIDNLIVRKVFQVFELLVQEIKHQGGMVLHSPAGGKITKVTDGGSYWKCEIESADIFFKDDLVICQKFTGTIKRYWRSVTSVGTGYINLSKTDCEANSAIPQIGDEIAVQGNKTNTSRQSVYIINVVGGDAPYTAYYSNINSYSLKDKLVTREGNLNGIIDPDFGALKGYGLYATNSYLKGILRLTNGKTVEQELLSTNNTVEANRLQLGGEIDKAKADAKNAQDSVDNLQIGGRNYFNLDNQQPKLMTEPYCFEMRSTTKKGNTPIFLGRKDIDFKDGDVFILSYRMMAEPSDSNTFECAIRIIENNITRDYLYPPKSEWIDGWVYCEHVIKVRNQTDSVWNMELYNHRFGDSFNPYIRYEQLKLEKSNKKSDWSPAPEDQQAELNKQITSVRTDFDVIEGQINANVKETQRLISVSNEQVNQATEASNKAQQNADKAKLDADLANKKALEAQINADKTKADANASNQSKLYAQAKADEAKAQADKANQEAIKAKSDADKALDSANKAKEAQDKSEGVLKSVATKEAGINVVAGQVDIKAKEATESATRAETAEANINTKADGIVMEASKQSAEKAIDGLEIGVNNLLLNSAFNTLKGWHSNGSKETDISEISPFSGKANILSFKGAGFYQRIGSDKQATSFKTIKDKSYTFAFYAKTEGDDVKLKVGVEGDKQVYPIANSEWQRFEYTFKSVGDKHTFILYTYSASSIRVYFTEPILIEGNKVPYRWNESQLDLDTRFSETNASLNVLTDQIASEVSKTNGIRTDLTQVQQSHNEFKVQVVEDVADAIDKNNEVVKSSFGMKDNILTAYGKEFNVLANLKVGEDTLITQDGKIRTKLLDVEEIEDNTIFGGFVFMGGLLISQEGTDAEGNFSTNWIEYKTGNFKPNLILDPKEGSSTALKGKFGLLQIVGNMLACYSKSSKELFRLTGEKVPSVNSFSLGWSIYKPFDVYETFIHPINIDSQDPVAETFYGVLNVPFTVDKAGEYRFTDYTVAISSDPAIPNSKIIHSSTADIFLGSKRIYADIDLDNLDNDYLEFYAPEPGDYTIVLRTTMNFIQLQNSFYKVTIGMGIRGILTKVGPSETTYIGSDGLYTSFTTGEFLHYKSGEGFSIRAGNHGLRVSKQGIQKWNGSQWVTANI